MSDNQEYVGKLVLVERAEPSKEHSSHYDGEKLVLRATPNQLFTIPMDGYSAGITVYGLGGYSSGGQIPLKGAGRYNVISVDPIPNWVFKELDSVEKQCHDVIQGRQKAQWVESVYHQALNKIRQIRELTSSPELKPEAVITYSKEYAPLPKYLTLQIGDQKYHYRRDEW